jgi:hypothetical protein
MRKTKIDWHLSEQECWRSAELRARKFNKDIKRIEEIFFRERIKLLYNLSGFQFITN